MTGDFFRTAVNGFRKEDVLAYIKESEARAEALRKENDRLRQELLASDSKRIRKELEAILHSLYEARDLAEELERENLLLREKLQKCEQEATAADDNLPTAGQIRMEN
ncbi:MAG: hypothetical protein LBR73_06370 [Oscillospiraceae bacterium]|nr:hypothetical protein [Oscillospiraceae bacterium]